MKTKRSRLLKLVMASVVLLILIIAIDSLLGLLESMYSDIPHPGWAWSGYRIQTWIDENENGVWDASEPPLQDVEFSIVYIRRDGTSLGSSNMRSNRKGRVDDWSDMYFETPVKIEISVDPPGGYRPTTQTRISIRTRDEGSFLFGFTYLPEAPTVTPFPPAPICVSANLSEEVVDSIAIAPDSTLWLGTWGGAAHLDPSKGTQEIYRVVEGRQGHHSTPIAVSSDNVVWIGTYEGIRRFDGTSWTTYTAKDGLTSNRIIDLTIAADGTVWCVTDDAGISYFSSSTERWITIAKGQFSITATHIAPAPDGSIWISAYSGIFQVSPIIDSNGSLITYGLLGPLGPNSLGYPWVHDMVFVGNELWIVGGCGFGRFSPEIGGFRRFSYYDFFTTLALAPDGSFWLGTRDDGIRHFVPPEDGQGEGTWTYYLEDEILSCSISKMIFTPDGTLWVVASQDAAQCIIQEE